MIVAFSGYPRAGKDTAAEYLISKHQFRRVALADKLKHLAKDLMGVEYREVDKEEFLPEWNMTRRQVWQRVGQQIRAVHPEIWIRYIADMFDLYANVVVTDVRYPNEIDFMRKLGAKCFRIDRDGTGSTGHESDDALAKYKKWDAIISNNGTVEQLHQEIARLVDDKVGTPHVPKSPPADVRVGEAPRDPEPSRGPAGAPTRRGRRAK